MRLIIERITFFFTAMLLALFSYAQTGSESALLFNKMVHNFGKISIEQGPVNCSFEFTNTSDKPVVINNIISSCGCARPKWPREPIMPGGKGKIDVTYLNDQGPYPFEKNITLYTSASKKPIILRISGIAYEKDKSLKDIFPVTIGPLGIMRNNIGGGQIEQGYSKSGSLSIANFSKKSVKIEFTNLSKGLTLTAIPGTLAAGEVGEITYNIDTKEALNWGNTIYKGYLICNGVKAETPINISCMIIDNISALSAEQKNNSSLILAKNSSVTLSLERGAQAVAKFSLRNTGASNLIIHKADTNGDTFDIEYPTREIKPSESFEITAKIATSEIESEKIFTITLITNSPKRPLVNLFVAIETK